MDWQLVLLLITGSFLGLLFMGVPVVYAFFSINIVAIYLLMGGLAGLSTFIMSMYDSLALFTMLPITLFILMGEVMFRTGIAPRMLETIDKWLGKVPGRMSLVAVMGGTLFATLSGASIGSTAMLGSTLLPEMERRGYHRSISIGPILGSGGLSVLIPPSGLGVILAIVAKISVGDLLLGITIPGFMLAGIYIIYIVGRCALQPEIAPAYDVEYVSLKDKLISTAKYVLPLGTIIFLVLGLIFLGVATPTESAALGTMGSFILAACYKNLSWTNTKKALDSTMRTSVMVLSILAASSAFAQVLAFSGVSRELINWTVVLPLPPMLLVVLMILIVFFLGMFIGGTALIMVTVPIFMPVIHSLNMNPLWFGVLLLIAVEVGQITPPYGILLYLIKGIGPKGITTEEVIWAAIPFIVMVGILIAILMIFPGIVSWLPNLGTTS